MPGIPKEQVASVDYLVCHECSSIIKSQMSADAIVSNKMQKDKLITCRAAVVSVAGLAAPLLVEGTIGDVEEAVCALEKVGIATSRHVINVRAMASSQLLTEGEDRQSAI